MADLTPYTSPWWLDRLGRQLDERIAIMGILDRYYNGNQPLKFASPEFRKTYRDRFAQWSDNFCKPVVQALEERLTVQGFRFGGPQADGKAWTIWQANEMDAQSQKAHREAIIKGDCPVIVAPPKVGGTSPIIRVQKPEELVVAYGDDPLERAVAMKRWVTPAKQTFATLYYPDRIEKYQRDSARTDWTVRQVAGEDWPLEHAFGVVPVVPIVNDPDLDNQGASEIASVLPLQDAINKLFIDLLVASEYGAFRQRWATGIEIPIDPETKKPIENFRPAVDRIWSTPVPDAKFGDFDQTDVGGILKGIETGLQHIAAETRTPYHYFMTHGGQPPSGESLRAAETGLVAKAKRRTRDFGEGWEEIVRLAFRAIGNEKRATYEEAETIWADPETRSESEHVDALVKLAAIGVPEEQLWEDAGYSPEQIKQFSALRAASPTPAVKNKAVTGPADQTMPGMPGMTPPDMAAA